jgi:hypothetical protein
MTLQEKRVCSSHSVPCMSEMDLKNSVMPSQLKQFLADNNECYVLITCGKPTKDGKMQVEMTYEGDATLAAYLIESAHGIMDENHEAEMYS